MFLYFKLVWKNVCVLFMWFYLFIQLTGDAFFSQQQRSKSTKKCFVFRGFSLPSLLSISPFFFFFLLSLFSQYITSFCFLPHYLSNPLSLSFSLSLSLFLTFSLFQYLSPLHFPFLSYTYVSLSTSLFLSLPLHLSLSLSSSLTFPSFSLPPPSLSNSFLHLCISLYLSISLSPSLLLSLPLYLSLSLFLTYFSLFQGVAQKTYTQKAYTQKTYTQMT